MSINPFDDDNGSFFVLVNDEEQHSHTSQYAGYLFVDGEGKSTPVEGSTPDEGGVSNEHVVRMRDASSCSYAVIHSPYFALTSTTVVT